MSEKISTAAVVMALKKDQSQIFTSVKTGDVARKSGLGVSILGTDGTTNTMTMGQFAACYKKQEWTPGGAAAEPLDLGVEAHDD